MARFPLLATVQVCPTCESAARRPDGSEPIPLEPLSKLPYLYDSSDDPTRRQCDAGHTVEPAAEILFHAVAISNLGMDGRTAPPGRVFISDGLFRGLETVHWSFRSLLGCDDDVASHPSRGVIFELVRIHVQDAHLLCRRLFVYRGTYRPDEGEKRVSIFPHLC